MAKSYKDVFDKAENLGFDTSVDSYDPFDTVDNTRMSNLAGQLGLDPNNFSVDEIDRKLDEISNESLQEAESIPEDTTTGEVVSNGGEYSNQLPDGFGKNQYMNTINNRNYYSDRNNELTRNLKQARDNRNNKFKSGLDKDGNPITKEKNLLDKGKDNLDVAKAKGAQLANKLDQAKSLAYAANHPEEAGEVAKEVAKKEIKRKIQEKIVAVIAENPWILLVALVLVILIIVILFLLILNPTTNNANNESNYACGSSVDSPISVTQTPLSRNEFIEALQNFQSTNSHYAELRDNAGLVYDLGIEYGINPELAVIRAELEGYSPGSNYNFWGIGCYNGASSCTGSYTSLENGLIAFYNTIKAYNTDNIYEVMSTYAYIGQKWFSPGSSSDGGCYYYPYIREYLSPERDAEVGASCDQGTQILTNDEDQLAYTKWQVDNGTMSKRLAIFNLGPDSIPICESYDVDATPTPTTSDGILTSSDGTAETILAQHGSSVSKVNDMILQNTLQKGVGSREAVAGAASILINTFDSFGYRLPYSYSGGWYVGYTNSSGAAHNFCATCYYGVNPYFGEDIFYNGSPGYNPKQATGHGPNKYYYHLGMDCSGFVTWAFHNGGVDVPLTLAGDFRSYDGSVSHKANTTEYIGKTGDVLSSDGHVLLILQYNQDDQSYTTAEAGGIDSGIFVTKYSLSGLGNYDVVDMSNYYENYVHSNYEADFQNGRKA